MSMQLVAAFVATTFSGALMYFHGISVNLLARKRVRCRNCGGVPGRTCTCDRHD
jgi:hypothetical protein